MATNITFHPGPYFIRCLSGILTYLSQGSVTSSERAQLLSQKGATIWLTGLSASGKVRTYDILDLFDHRNLGSRPLRVLWSSTFYIYTNLLSDLMVTISDLD